MKDFVIHYNGKYNIWHEGTPSTHNDEQDGIYFGGYRLEIFIIDRKNIYLSYDNMSKLIHLLIANSHDIDTTSVKNEIFKFCEGIFLGDEKVFIEKVQFLHSVLRRISIGNVTQDELDSIRFSNTKSANFH